MWPWEKSWRGGQNIGLQQKIQWRQLSWPVDRHKILLWFVKIFFCDWHIPLPDQLTGLVWCVQKTNSIRSKLNTCLMRFVCRSNCHWLVCCLHYAFWHDRSGLLVMTIVEHVGKREKTFVVSLTCFFFSVSCLQNGFTKYYFPPEWTQHIFPCKRWCISDVQEMAWIQRWWQGVWEHYQVNKIQVL